MAQYRYDTKGGGKWLAKFRYKDPKTGEMKVEYRRGFATKRDAKYYEENFVDGLLNNETEDVMLRKKIFGDVYEEYMASHKREDMQL